MARRAIAEVQSNARSALLAENEFDSDQWEPSRVARPYPFGEWRRRHLDQAQSKLDETEQEQASTHRHLRALVIHEIVRRQGEEELRRPNNALAVSGFAAGLSMGFSLLVMAFLQAHLPDAPWRPLIASAGYSLGFIIVILGSQQLFTESTLTAVLPLLTKPSRMTLRGATRVWAVVLVANLAGTWLFALMLSMKGVFADPVWLALVDIVRAADADALFPSVMKAIMAGWLIALMVWLLPSAGSARLFIIMLLTYVVALGAMPHSVAGSVEAAFLVLIGDASAQHYLLHFLIPTFVGNSVGGVALAAMLNHVPIAAELSQE